MKKQFKLALLFAISLTGLASCTDYEEIASPVQTNILMPDSRQAMEEETDTFAVHAMYKNADYYSLAVLEGDSISYLDGRFNELMEKVEKISGSVSFVHLDGSVEYFDSQEEFYAKYGIRDLNEQEKSRCLNVERLNEPLIPSARGIVANYQNAIAQMNSNDLVYAGVYDDTYYSDTHIFMHITDPYQIHEYPHLKSQRLNDKISSLVVLYNMDDRDLCAILTVWEDSNYNTDDHDRTKHRTNFVATYTNRTNNVGNLKKVSCFHAHDSWNDRISSLSFRVGHADSLPNEY